MVRKLEYNSPASCVGIMRVVQIISSLPKGWKMFPLNLVSVGQKVMDIFKKYSVDHDMP